MAFDFSKLSFSRLDARARVLVLFAGIIVVFALIYMVVSFMSSSEGGTIGPSTVASAPQGAVSMPGGKLTPEYEKTLRQANQQSAETAAKTGSSAIPTVFNTAQNSEGCTVLCGDDSANINVGDTMNNWVKTSKMPSAISTQLQTLANKNVSIAEFSSALAKLVTQGKITPEQARLLAEQYRKQHSNIQIKDSANFMDSYIKNGTLPIDAANDLLALQKRRASIDEYKAALKKMIDSGKISDPVAQQLLNQYSQQQADEIIKQNLSDLQQMVADGGLSKETGKIVEDLISKKVPIDQLEAKLNQLVQEGKMSPEARDKILAAYKKQKADLGNLNTVQTKLQIAEAQAFGDVSALQKSGNITSDTASQITDLMKSDPTADEFNAKIDAMVAAGQLTKDQAALIKADYARVKNLRGLTKNLSDLQANNATAQQYEDALKAAVASGILTPEEAASV